MLLVLCAWARLVHAAPDSVYLEELTWTEVRDLLHAGATTIIVPAGGTEQNGPAMVLGKHNVRVKALAGRIARGLGHTIVAPVIAYVPEGALRPPTGHMRFAGTISVPGAIFEGTLEYAVRSFRQHGFKDIVLLGDSGGYQDNMQRVADKLNREWSGQGTRVHALVDYYRALDVQYPKLLKDKGYTDDEIGLHAGLADTSLAMAVDAQLVRSERLKGTFGAADGVRGQPGRSSAQAGQWGADLIVTRSIESIRRELARR